MDGFVSTVTCQIDTIRDSVCENLTMSSGEGSTADKERVIMRLGLESLLCGDKTVQTKELIHMCCIDN